MSQHFFLERWESFAEPKWFQHHRAPVKMGYSGHNSHKRLLLPMGRVQMGPRGGRRGYGIQFDFETGSFLLSYLGKYL